MVVKVNSPNVAYGPDSIVSQYQYQNTLVESDGSGRLTAKPMSLEYTFETKTKLPKFGLMMVGWGGNNGSTLTASIVANKYEMKWRTRQGVQTANYWGSMVMASTVRLGVNAKGDDMFVPIRDLVPMVHPNDFVLGGWDINGANIAEAMERAQVLEPDLQRQLYPFLKEFRPMPSVYYPDYIAANQSDRADNLIPSTDKQAHLEQIRKDIREFTTVNGLDSVVVVWTANTERFSDIIPGVNDTANNLLSAIKNSHEEVAPSTIFAVACILEHVPFINGSPQNTFVPGAMELAEREGSFIGGDDFKSGQTKMKSVMVDFLVSAGIKPLSIVSYNHLGNNDGKNLSAPSQFRSKEISKSNVVDDMVASNRILYDQGEKPDHCVVIKYVPAVGDSKRAMDEYVSEIFMGGRSTFAIHNTCEDSLLASPLIIDLALIAELMTRVTYKTAGMSKAASFHSVLSILSYMLKAPVVPPNTPVINALSKQRMALENILRALVGLMPQNEMLLEHKAC